MRQGKHKSNFKGKRKKSHNDLKRSLTKKQKKHYKEFGEAHPFDTQDTVQNYSVVKDDSTAKTRKEMDDNGASSSDEDMPETSAYNQLLQSFVGNNGAKEAVVSESEDDDDDNDINCDEAVSGGDIALHVTPDVDSDASVTSHEDNDATGTGDDVNDDDTDDKSDAETSLNDVTGVASETDPFSAHFERDLPEDSIPKLQAVWKLKDIQLKVIGRVTRSWKLEEYLPQIDQSQCQPHTMHINQKLLDELAATNRTLGQATLTNPTDVLSPFQTELFNLIHTYQDVYYPRRTHENGEGIRVLYCLHALNHALKTRHRVMANRAKIKASKASVDVDYRDQGLTRPKVLVIVPFRESVLRLVNIMIELMSAKGEGYVSNKKKLHKEFSDAFDELPRKSSKSDDYLATFAGNTDDHFRLGLSIAKKTLKIYTQFYKSDIVVASPLGLRTVINGSGEDGGGDHDFLSSIELLILDQTDVFLMQNWDHLLYIMDHLHLQPSEAHGVDFSRVRMWSLNGWAKYYRQTLIFSAVPSPLINSLFTKHCHNYRGKLSIHPPATTGSICQVITQLPQVFHKFDCDSYTNMPDARFNYFINKILPHHKDTVMSRTLIFIPSYFDYVRVRNYLAREELNFTQICEYTKLKNISRARNDLFRGNVHFLLYTERAHFYHRLQIRGVHHLIYYALPQYPATYPELCNTLHPTKLTDTLTCSVIYCQYDAQCLAQTVGTKRASHMLSSHKATHMFVTGENG